MGYAVRFFSETELAEAEGRYRLACQEAARRAGRDDARRIGAPIPNRFIAAEWQAEYEAAFQAEKHPKEVQP